MTKSKLIFLNPIGLMLLVKMLIPLPSAAQEKLSPEEDRFTFDFGGGLGLFLPAKSRTEKAASSFADNNFVQVNYKRNVFARLQSFKYTNQFQVPTNKDGIETDFDVKVHTRNLGLHLGFCLDIQGVQPYAFVGGGLAFLDIPTSSYDAVSNTITYRQKMDKYSFVSWGLGVNFKESEALTVFVEATGLYMYNLPAGVRHSFNGAVLSVGIKTPLSSK